MPTHEHDDALAGMDYEIAKSLPRNPYTHSMQVIPEGEGPQPNLAQLAGPMYPGGLMTLEADSHEKLETEGGFPVPDAQEYGDKEGTHTVADAQGVVTTPVVRPVIDPIPGKDIHKRMYFQDEQANKTPDDWDNQTRTVPSVPGSVELLVGSNQHRDELLIYNNGANTVYVGRTENKTGTSQGFPVAVGGVFKLKAQGPVYVFVDNSNQTTLNVIETSFSEYKSFEKMTGHGGN